MKIKSWMKIPAVLIVGAGLTLAMPALAAVGQSSPPSSVIQIESTKATVLAGGLAVELPIRYFCATGAFSQSASASISAVSHKSIITASANFTPSCTGKFETVKLILDVVGQKFLPGPALASAQMDVCDFDAPPFSCITLTTAKTVELT